MPEFISVMTIGDIFDRTFKLIGKTFTRNAIIALLMNIPPFILLLLGGHLAISSVSGMIDRWEYATPEVVDVLQLLVFPLLLFVVGGLAATVAYVWSFMAVYIVTGKTMSDEPVTWQEAASLVASRVAPGLGYTILMSLALMALFIVPYGIMIGGIVMESVVTGILGGLLFFVSILGVIYLSIRWVFGLNTIAWEDAGVFEAFTRSTELVKGRWWRTFGILMLLGIVAQFAISMVAGPVAFIGFIGPYIDLLSAAGNNTTPDPATIVNLVTGMMYGYLIAIALSVVLTVIIQPVYTMVLYFDCRARNGEFDDEMPPAPTDPDDTMQLGDNWQNVSV